MNRLVSALWSTANALARHAPGGRARLGAARVISVGNIQAGGAGKTPLVARLAREGAHRGLSVCVLTRGYRGRWEREQGVLGPGEPAPGASVCGDEPALLHELAPGAWIGVGADRVASFEEVERRAGKIDLVILDDGFQNRKIRKDLEIVALTSASRGEKIFRDWPSALERADLLIWTKGEKTPEHLPKDKPLLRARFEIPKPASPKKIFLITGIEDGNAAASIIKEAGYFVRHRAFPDHHAYRADEVRKLLDEARAAGETLALTGKDWVKWQELGINRAEVEVLEPEVVFEPVLWNRIVWGA